jgi:outer membrane protein assembly factor BamB
MLRPTLLASLLFIALTSPVRAENWPEFRGPTGQGHYAGKTLPLEWGPDKNVVWKEKIPGRGWSSPIVFEGRVYLTTAIPVSEEKKGDQSLCALCLDAATGKLLWQTPVFLQKGSTAPNIHGKNSHASPTAIIDGKRLYVHFGHQGTAALDFQGKILWRNTELKYAPVHGNGGSLILADGKLVFSIDGSDKQMLVALDPETGKVLWQTDRKSSAVKKFSFSTPLYIADGGRKQIISPASDMVAAYDPADGKELWRVKYTGYSVIPRPVYGHGLVFLSTSYDVPALFAIRVDGTGVVTDSHVAWTFKKGAPHAPSALLVGDELYVVSDKGTASCLDARTGKVHWQARVGEQFSASPLYADGRIYFQSEDGVTTVVRAGTKFEQLAQSQLGEKTLASYAVADGAIYLRTEKHLYRLQER